MPWLSQASDIEPWQLLILPLLGVSCAWPVLREWTIAGQSPRLLSALLLAATIMLSALPSGESYADVVPANAAWSVWSLLAIGMNIQSAERLDATGARRWSLWVFVAQLATVAALLMTCYGTLGQWSASAGLALAAWAACRIFVTEGNWSSVLALAATTLSCTLLTHVRIYSTQALPVWLAPLPMLLPAATCLVDQAFGKYRSARVRVLVAAASATAMVITVVVTMLLTSISPDDQW